MFTSLLIFCLPLSLPQEMTTVLFQDGLQTPVFVTAPPEDPSRLFVIEKDPALLRIIKDGVLLNDPVLDLSGSAITGGEQGFLGAAFHPRFKFNRQFFVNFTGLNGNTNIVRFEMYPDQERADLQTAQQILLLNQPFPDHNAGMMAFSPLDGYLYICTGDGGAGWIGDPLNNAQNSASLFGKVLRIDVTNQATYAIPPDNPFVGPGNPRDEIWALGLRNPWRFSFDRENGDLWIADVGQITWEEISYQSAQSPGGENYGWRLKEGDHCFNPTTQCDPGGLTDPIYEYEHGGIPYRCSVTGGYVYRGKSLANMRGHYFFADFCSTQIWTMRYDEQTGQILDFTDRTLELDPGGGLSIRSISSFGEDARGELYICDLDDGEIFKIIPQDLTIEAKPLKGLSFNDFHVFNANQNEDVYFFYSFDGLGTTNFPLLGVDLGLLNPIQATIQPANSNGEVFLSKFVSGSVSGARVYIQVAQIGQASNVWTDVFE